MPQLWTILVLIAVAFIIVRDYKPLPGTRQYMLLLAILIVAGILTFWAINYMQ